MSFADKVPLLPRQQTSAGHTDTNQFCNKVSRFFDQAAKDPFITKGFMTEDELLGAMGQVDGLEWPFFVHWRDSESFRSMFKKYIV